jgi:hypothetical protein
MLKATIINRINFPEIKLQGDLENIAREIVIPDIEKHIDMRASIDMGALPFNEPATIKRKGHDHQLIDTGQLRDSFFYRTSGKNKVIISIKGDRKEIGGYLQNDGVGKKKKHYRFFGLSEFAIKEALRYVMDKIGELPGVNRRK